MSGHSAFRKHGTYIYSVPETLNDYGGADLTIAAIKSAGMSHAWVRIHGENQYPQDDRKKILYFVDALRANGIAVAGWGWCQGADVLADAKLASKEISYFKLEHYIADIEHGHHNSNWSESEIVKFCERVRTVVTGGFGITTFALIEWHKPSLITAAMPFVDMFNPQIYWFHYPNKKMIKQFKKADGSSYALDNSASYADLCIDAWQKLIGNGNQSLVVTGAAYWGEGIDKLGAEDKLDEFLNNWNGFEKIGGVNWWHFGGKNCMSHKMLAAITNAKLNDKKFKYTVK